MFNNILVLFRPTWGKDHANTFICDNRLEAVAQIASKAKVVTIATSPHYIDQKRAIIYAKVILNRMKELKSAQGVSRGSSENSSLPKSNENSDQVLLAFDKPVYLGGERKGGECVSPFTDNDIEVWVELSPGIEGAEVPFRIWRQDGQINVQRYVRKRGEPIEGDIEVFEPELDFIIGREDLERKDKAGNIKISSISRWHCAMRMEENDAGQYRIVVSDLNSTHGLRVEMRQIFLSKEDDLVEPGHGPGAGPIIEGPNNLVREATVLIEQGKIEEAKALLEEAIARYQAFYEARKDDEADTLSYEMAQAAQKNITIAQGLLKEIDSNPQRGGIDLNVNKLEIKGEGLYLPDFSVPFNIENFGGFTFQITSIERVQDWASLEVAVEGPQT